MAKVVKCPSCGRNVTWNDEARFRPFCSERCKMIDLGAWASGGYSIAGSDIGTEAAPDISTEAPKTSNH
jgi:uncharacterized protein